MRKTKRFLSKLLMWILVFTFVFSSTILSAFANSETVAVSEQADSDTPTTITVNFPGMHNVRLTYNVAGGVGWINLPDRHDNTVTFELPEGHERINTIRVYCSMGGNNFVISPLTVTLNKANVFDVPVIPIRVFGINSPNTVQIGVINPNWVVSMHNVQGPVDFADDLLFNVFRNNRDFIVRLTNHGQANFDITVNEYDVEWNVDEGRYEMLADFGKYFYSVTVPEGVTFVNVAETNWIYQAPNPPVSGDVMWFLPTGQTGRLMFDYNGVRHDFVGGIRFDGTCIFCQVQMPACPGGSGFCTHCCENCPYCVACEYCGTCQICSDCPPFSLTHQLRPTDLEIIRVGFRNPRYDGVDENGDPIVINNSIPVNNVVPYVHFDVRVTVDGRDVSRDDLSFHMHTAAFVRQVNIPLEALGNNWEEVTIWVSRGCADASITVRNPDFDPTPPVPFIVRFNFYTDRPELFYSYIDLPVIPGLLSATWDQEVLEQVWSIGNIYGTADAPGHAFWGWFDDDTLDASDRTRGTAPDVLRRPALTDTCMLETIIARIELALTPEARKALFGNADGGILDLYGIWALWGDVDDDDYVTSADLDLLRRHIAIGPLVTIPLNLRAANVVVDRYVNAADLDLLRRYITIGHIPGVNIILGQQPPPP